MTEKLKELYQRRKAFEMYGSEVPEKLLKEIEEAETSEFRNIANTIASYFPREIDEDVNGTVLIAGDYVNGKLTAIGYSCSPTPGMASQLQETIDISDDDDADDDEPEIMGNERKRRPRVKFTVKFADGKVIRRNAMCYVMIDALRYMGLERASQYRGDTFNGYPLISKDKRADDVHNIYQKHADGWWIYTNMDNPQKIACIKGVAEMLNIPLEIEMDTEMALSQPTDRPKGKRTKFSLNGGEPTWKNRTVWNTVRNLLKELPNATFKEISDFFPKQLQGSYGVVATVADIEERSKRNKSEYNRWFLDPSDILTAGDGTRFTVTTEWGDNFENFRNHVKREFDWTIEEA